MAAYSLPFKPKTRIRFNPVAVHQRLSLAVGQWHLVQGGRICNGRIGVDSLVSFVNTRSQANWTVRVGKRMAFCATCCRFEPRIEPMFFGLQIVLDLDVCDCEDCVCKRTHDLGEIVK